MFIFCPNCGIMLMIEDVNCGIFRCGIMKDSLLQIGSHLDKINCDLLLSKNLIYGCSKPFKVGKEMIAEKCEYL